jgi:hypothetical protein
VAHSQLTARSSTPSESRSLTQWSGPLFIVGLWRSGTSLLYALLNKHPRIAVMYEGDLFLLRTLFWIPGAGSRWIARWEFWNDALNRHGLTAGRIQSNTSSVRTAMERAYQEYSCQKGAQIWGEKSPNYYDSLARLARDFPDARFIIIWRDLAAICRSVVCAAQGPSWFNRRGMTHRALMGYKTLRTECDRLVRRGASVYQIQYEALVENPADVMMGVCKFLGVPFVSCVASLNGADTSAIYNGRHHSLVKGERIGCPVERPEILPIKLQKKIDRYSSLWHHQSRGTWPVSPCSQNYDHGKPTLAERVFDQLAYHALRSFDYLVLLAYCFVPFRFLRKYRALKYRRRESSVKMQKRRPAGQRQSDLPISPPSALRSPTLAVKHQDRSQR